MQLRPPSRNGRYYMLSLLSMPFMLLARTGLLGDEARSESNVAMQDWAGLGKPFVYAFAAVVLGIVFGTLLITIL